MPVFQILQRMMPMARWLMRQSRLKYTSESLTEIRERIEHGQASLVDVRTCWEWNSEHLHSAEPLPLWDLQTRVDAEEIHARIPIELPVYVHCVHGPRAVMAGEVLQSLGYDARPLKVGFSELREAGFAVADETE